jgi:hypothetical protein
MKTPLLTILSLFIIILTGCQGNDSVKAKELELREKELELRERELNLQAPQSDNTNNNSTGYSSSNDNNQYNRESSQKPTEQELKEDLYKREMSSPKEYLTLSYSYRVNLAANTIIEGNISNSASVAGFKNVKMTVYFYSKTDVVVGKETFTVMEFVPANRSISFRHKITGWWSNAVSSKYSIISADPY